MFDLLNKHSAVAALNPSTAVKTATTGVTVDLQINNGSNSVMFAVIAGTITDGTHTFTLQDSPDGSAWTNVPAAYIQFGTGAAAGFTSSTTAGTVIKIGYLGNTNGGYRYVRLSVTASGTTGGLYSAIAFVGHGALLPAA